MKSIVSILLLLISLVSFSQNFSDEEQLEIDSLNALINNPTSHDTSIAGSYMSLSELLYIANPDTDFYLCQKTIDIAEHGLKNNPNKAERKSYLLSLSTAFNNLAYAYKMKGNIPQAIELHHKAIKIIEELGEMTGLATSLINIGLIYQTQGDNESAIKYIKKAKKVAEDSSQKDINAKKDIISKALNALGYTYSGMGNNTLALKEWEESLRLRREVGGKGEATIINNIAMMYKKTGDLDKAKKYFYEAFLLYKEMGSKNGEALILNNIASIQFIEDSLTRAEANSSKSMSLAQEIGFPKNIMQSARLLSQIYEKQDKGMKALEMYKLYVQMKDSINNEETQKASIRQQTQYEFEKEQIRKENEAKEHARIEAAVTKRRNNLQYSLIFLGILLLFGVVLSLGFIKVSPNVAEGLIFFAFLILFEFILVFTDPHLQELTHDEPMYNLAANAIIALMIFPLHAVLERLLKKRIVKS